MNKEEFLTELEGRGFEFLDKTETDQGFKDDLLNMAYEMWLAGISHQQQTIESLKAQLAQQSDDYVLVPRNLSEEMWKEGVKWFAMTESLHDVYKAMIEAQEQHNG